MGKYPEKNYHSPPAKKKRKVPPKIEVKIEPEIKEEPEEIPAQVPVKNKKVPAKHPSSTNSQSQVPVKKMRKEKVVLKIIEDVPVKKEVPLKKGVAKKTVGGKRKMKKSILVASQLKAGAKSPPQGSKVASSC